MTTPAALRSLLAIDLRSVTRDPLLRWVLLLTPGFGLLFRFGAPVIGGALEQRWGFDLVTYYPLLMSLLPLMVAGMLGAVFGFLLLDQRDDQTLPALMVTPLSLRDYFGYRIVLMSLLCLALTAIVLPTAELTTTNALQIGVTALVAAPLVPLYALLLASFAHNKVQGFALAKAFGLVLLPLIAAYFVSGPVQLLFGVVPHYWCMKVFWLFDAGRPVAALGHAALGLAWQLLLLTLLLQRFAKVLRR